MHDYKYPRAPTTNAQLPSKISAIDNPRNLLTNPIPYTPPSLKPLSNSSQIHRTPNTFLSLSRAKGSPHNLSLSAKGEQTREGEGQPEEGRREEEPTGEEPGEVSSRESGGGLTRSQERRGRGWRQLGGGGGGGPRGGESTPGKEEEVGTPGKEEEVGRSGVSCVEEGRRQGRESRQQEGKKKKKNKIKEKEKKKKRGKEKEKKKIKKKGKFRRSPLLAIRFSIYPHNGATSDSP